MWIATSKLRNSARDEWIRVRPPIKYACGYRSPLLCAFVGSDGFTMLRWWFFMIEIGKFRLRDLPKTCTLRNMAQICHLPYFTHY